MLRLFHSHQFIVDRKTHSPSEALHCRAKEGHFKVNHGFTLIELMVACHPTCPPKIYRRRKHLRRKATLGFTLIELMVVMGIFALMLGFASINLIRPQTQASLDTTVTTLVSDLKQQQIRAMSGDGPSAYGVYLEPNRYTLFTGDSYQPAATSNFTINLETGLTTGPTTQIVFAQRSGETSTTTIMVTNTNSNQTKTVTINQYGAALVQ